MNESDKIEGKHLHTWADVGMEIPRWGRRTDSDMETYLRGLTSYDAEKALLAAAVVLLREIRSELALVRDALAARDGPIAAAPAPPPDSPWDGVMAVLTASSGRLSIADADKAGLSNRALRVLLTVVRQERATYVDELDPVRLAIRYCGLMTTAEILEWKARVLAAAPPAGAADRPEPDEGA